MKNIRECLLGVEYYHISENYIAGIREKRYDREKIFQLLPDFTINSNDYNQPILAEYFHQFIGWEKSENPKIFIYFNLKTIDNILQEDIDNAGIEELFKEYDFKEILSVFKPHTDDDIKHLVLPSINYLIIEETYIGGYDYYYGGYEYDIETKIVGYLDSNLNKKYFNHEKIYKLNKELNNLKNKENG